ncbi:MAG: decaprenylphospho-beta-D-erythro-pentofuranosid-2-ulose 2-reductase [Nostocoides sp.]
MKDAVNNVQNIVLLGGTSAIGLATVRALLGSRSGTRVVLAARPSPARAAAAAELTGLGAEVVATDLDVADLSVCREQVEAALAGPDDVDVVLVAFGVLGDQETAWQDVDVAAHLIDVNHRGAVVCGVLAANRLRQQGHGAIVLLSTVAGEQIRRSNFPYGSSKAGADGFFLGLGDAVSADGVHVLVVRPGFVRSPMTEGLADRPMTLTPDQVATAVVDGLNRRRRLVWAPAPMRPVMAVLRHLPRPLLRRLPV